jgi:PAS domain S-box-containing protein
MTSSNLNKDTLELYKYIYDEILDISEDGFLVVDSDGIIIDINNTYCKFLKTTRENAIGIHVLDLIPNSKMAEMVKGGVREHNVIHTFNADQNINGDNFVWVTSKSPVKKNGKIVAAVAQIKFKQQTINLAKKIKSQDCQLQYYKEEVKRLGAGKYSFSTMIGNCHLFLKAKSLAIKSAKSDFPVLLTGETGTGKEVFSNSIHYSSDRRNYPMVRINCAAIPSELLESELFGYEDGAFTGAKKGGRKGKFELADKGTIFLDEIGDMPLHMQSKLLRVLQEQEIERIGGNKSIKVDVRIIAATHQNLRKMVDEGKFREDLFYRLNVININIPPLRERKDDILHFAKAFLNNLNKKYKKEVELSNEAIECLMSHRWPGNIRELKNIIEGAFAISDNNIIDLSHLPSNIVTNSKISRSISGNKKFNELMADYEKQIILDCLRQNNNNCNRTAEELGIHRSTLYKKLDKLNIQVER